MGKEVVGSDPGPWDDLIQLNYSLRRAFFSTHKDSYRLHYLFPRLARGIKRRLSEETPEETPSASNIVMDQ